MKTSSSLPILIAEFLGTLLLVTAVVGSGIMAQQLTQDVALALLANTIATGAALYVLISILGPISGAHFNPVVTLVFAVRNEIAVPLALGFVAAQIAGGALGTILAHAMFDQALVQVSSNVRAGVSQGLSEVVATFGLVLTILLSVRFKNNVAIAVGLYITAAYWFTASTSFANPAVAIARTLTDTFSGIRPLDAPLFIACQILGALLAWALVAGLWGGDDAAEEGA